MGQLAIKFDAPELSSIEPSRAEMIRSTFEPMAAMLTEFESAYSEIIAESEKEITKELTGKAKRLRLDIGKVRIETEKIRKAEKEEYLRAGKAIDGVSNILKWAVTDKENRLKEIEDHFVIMERKRLEALQKERVEALSPYVEDAHERDLASMEDDVWNAYLAAKKKEYEDRIEAERKAEEERIAREKAEAEERERIRKENERLKKEAEERARLEKIEAEKRAKEEADRKKKEEAERKAREEKERKEREAHEAELRKAAEERAKLEAELKRQEEERRRLEEERIAKEKAEAEAKAKAEKVAQDKAHRAKVNRGIAEKLVAGVGVDEATAQDIVRLVASGKVPNLVIQY